MSPLCTFHPGKAIRGGVPVCWPWFGKAGSPSHGPARLNLWELVSSRELSDGRLSVTLSYTPEQGGGLCAELETVIGPESLSQTLKTRAGSDPLLLSEALHSYLSVGDLPQAELAGLSDAPFSEHAEGGTEENSSPLRFERPMDRIYSSGKEVSLYDPVLNRTLTLSRTGSGSVVVWTPWIEGAKTMADLPDEDWTRFICVETANIGGESIRLAPGESHSMNYTLSVCRGRK